MKILIVGCGRVGSILANLYDKSGHEVSVVDEDEGAAMRLEQEFRGNFFRGVGLDVSVLLDAGIEDTEVCLVATDGDNTNLVVAQIAREQFHVPCVVVRVFDPNRAKFFEARGLRVICPVALTADLMHQAVSDFRGEEDIE
jgi:trk system potassium uptake protein